MIHFALITIAFAPVIANWLLGSDTPEPEFTECDVRHLDEAFERILTEYHGR